MKPLTDNEMSKLVKLSLVSFPNEKKEKLNLMTKRPKLAELQAFDGTRREKVLKVLDLIKSGIKPCPAMESCGYSRSGLAGLKEVMGGKGGPLTEWVLSEGKKGLKVENKVSYKIIRDFMGIPKIREVNLYENQELRDALKSMDYNVKQIAYIARLHLSYVHKFMDGQISISRQARARIWEVVSK